MYEDTSYETRSAVQGERLAAELKVLPRQSVERGTFIQKRQYRRSPLLKTTALEGKLTFDDPFLDSGVVQATKAPIPANSGHFWQFKKT